MPTNKNKFTVIVDDELLKEIEDFRYDNRFRSLSSATVALIHLGLMSSMKELFLKILKEENNNVGATLKRISEMKKGEE